MPVPTFEDRLSQLMQSYLGAAAMNAFADDDVTEIYVNPQENLLRLGSHSRDVVLTETELQPDRISQFLNAVATLYKKPLHRKSPALRAALPKKTFGGARLQGLIPQISEGPCFIIRKLATELYPLASYVEAGIMTASQHETICEAVAAYDNILVIGGTNSGKTTLCNALIKEMTDQCPRDRFLILEDTGELQCSAPDHLKLSTWQEDDAGDDLIDLVEYTLWANPTRILIGEVRDHSAYRLLDAWSTGHPGGCCTVHADDINGGLARLNRLACDAGVPDQTELIRVTIDLIIFIKGQGEGRRVADLARLPTPRRQSRYDLERAVS